MAFLRTRPEDCIPRGKKSARKPLCRDDRDDREP